MEFLVKFEITIPDKAPSSEVAEREAAEATAVAHLAELGHVARIWRLSAPGGPADALGLYRAESRAQLDTLLEALPLHEWMRTTVTSLEPHPNDPTRPPVGAAEDGSEP
jgi:muconolactone D-isomerase